MFAGTLFCWNYVLLELCFADREKSAKILTIRPRKNVESHGILIASTLESKVTSFCKKYPLIITTKGKGRICSFHIPFTYLYLSGISSFSTVFTTASTASTPSPTAREMSTPTPTGCSIVTLISRVSSTSTSIIATRATFIT